MDERGAHFSHRRGHVSSPVSKSLCLFSCERIYAASCDPFEGEKAPLFLDVRAKKAEKLSPLEAIIMKKLIVLSAFALLAACGGSDNKPATDPTTSAPTGTGTSADPSKAVPSTPSTATPAPGDTSKPADPTKK
jgi:hypothetical protein